MQFRIVMETPRRREYRTPRPCSAAKGTRAEIVGVRENQEAPSSHGKLELLHRQ
jgi:hypothetical protein